MPIEAECAFYFLRLRMEYFNIKIKEEGWLDQVRHDQQGTKGTKNIKGTLIFAAREKVEDLFKHLYATERFLEASFPFSKSVDCKKICDALRVKANNKVLRTIEEYTFAEGRENEFVSTFKDEENFKEWVDISNKMWHFLRSNKNQSTEQRICDLLNHTFSAYDQLAKTLNFVHNKRLEFQALLSMLILGVMKGQELISREKFFKRTDSTDQKLRTLVKGIAKYGEENVVSHVDQKLKTLVNGIVKYREENELAHHVQNFVL